MQLRILSLLEKVLNQKATPTRDENVVFWCPVCKLEKHKKKLVVFLDETSDKFGWWRCWNCKDSNGMSGRNLFKLFKKIKADQKYFYEIAKITDIRPKDLKDKDSIFKDSKPISKSITLPTEFKSLATYKNSVEYNDAYDFLISRGFNHTDIIKYNIGYCDKGPYAHRLIIPSYDSIGRLNYFVARTYYNKLKPKYKNPPIPTSEYVVFFEQHINWNYPVLFVEGIFDAMAAKRNAIPLLGQSLTYSLKSKLLEKDVNDIIIALDSDAIKTSMKYVEKFISEGINVKFIKLNKKDPADLGFLEFIKLYNNASDIDFENLIKLKLNF